ncbi:hypothetical protein GP2_024_00800 [Gordonia paraffinivorans NBRC 108238]|uniref:SnoaL-like domain-containing protein n=1 Tax=Gordonia paraffinivorans NBRC 108238 TaxID=1223543 RepID=A0ABQ0IM71_9ACTN|nr:nuclear transport factor 2 family protein [Gordonia paraffinivorans]GAC84653.1 hypothetical protein GP2_024_00800 [Gordonia paraffinivorans NBRC 108238]
MSTDHSILAAYPARYFDAWGDKDLDAALAVVAETLRWKDPVLPEVLENREGAKAFFQAGWQAFPDIAFKAVGEPLVDAPRSTVAQEWVMTGTHTGDGFPAGVSASGRSFEVEGIDVWILNADGQAVSVRAYYDAADFARQLGLA